MVAHPIQEAWQERAACRGPDSRAFFPPPFAERREARDLRERHAKAICASCSVQRECLAYALAIREPHGVWGGHTEAERRAILARSA